MALAVALSASAEAATTVGVDDGTLTITGDAAADQITLSGTRGTLQVSAGAQQFSVNRSTLRRRGRAIGGGRRRRADRRVRRR